MAARRWFLQVTASNYASIRGCLGDPFAARSRTVSCGVANWRGPHSGGREQPWEFSRPPWWANSVDKPGSSQSQVYLAAGLGTRLLASKVPEGNCFWLQKVPCYQGFERQLTSPKAHSLNNHDRHKLTAAGPRPSNGQHQSGLGGASLGAGSSTPGDELQKLCEKGRLEEAVDALLHMDHRGTASSLNVCRSLLQGCAQRKVLHQAKRIHAHLMKYGLDTTRLLGEQIVSTLVKCGGLEDALQLFQRLPDPSVFSWTAVISGCTMFRHGWEALRMFDRMQEEGVQPNTYTFVSLLKACASIPNLEAGKRIHAQALKYGCECDLFVANCLVDMYGKCGSIVDAQTVFDGLPQRDVVSWTAMIAACAEQGLVDKAFQLYLQLQEAGVTPNNRTFVSVLQACCMLADQEEIVFVDGQNTKVNALARGKVLHAEAHVKGFDLDVFVGSILVTMYHKCGSLVDAWNVFDGMSRHDVVTWTGMLMAYADQGQEERALQLYKQMQEEGVSPNHRTYVGVLQACSTLAEKEGDILIRGCLIKVNSLNMGKTLDAFACMKRLGSDFFVGSTLISLYAKCGSFMDAQVVFDRLRERDVVAWTAILMAYVEHGQAAKAFQLYEQMRESGVSPDPRSYVSILQACGLLADEEDTVVVDGRVVKVESLEKVKAMHGYIHREGFDSHVCLGSTLVSMYGKCGSIADAWNVFNRLSQPDAVAWTAMVMACVDHDQGENALQLYGRMQQEGVVPDDITLVSILQACSKIGNLSVLKQIHHTLVSSGNRLSPLLASTLISAYGRCASMVDAQTVFDSLPQPGGVVSWTALIAGYARQGDCAASLQCYEKMQLLGVTPNEVTFLAVLSACSHSGEVDKGVEYFQSMSTVYDIAPEIEHYVTMVDLLGRAGCFTRVQDLLSTMPVQPAFPIWLCLLGACQKHGKVELGEQAFRCAVSLQPNHSGPYVLMSNIYADAGMVRLELEVHELRRLAGAWKSPGRSWIGHEQEVHTFVVQDRNHLQEEELYDLLGHLIVEPGSNEMEAM